MISITNPKVAGLEPRWASFRGFSLLFDNPGDSLTHAGRRLYLTCAVDTDPALRLYRALQDAVDEIGPDELTDTYMFCPLPPPSYHVTVWDGCNAGNIDKVAAGYRAGFEMFLAALPDSLLQETAFTRMIAASPLVTTSDWDLRFQFGELVKWGNSVLVARLVPADGASERRLQVLTELRSRLTAEIREAFGIGPPETYSPHVSLGYFANRDVAEIATSVVGEWNRLVEVLVKGLTLPFRSVSLYGFTDMATFFKAAVANDGRIPRGVG